MNGLRVHGSALSNVPSTLKLRHNMKVKGKDPKEICLSLLKRSNCSVQVAAVLSAPTGIYAWGWNHTGPDGFGEHAEVNCLKRANSKRISKSVMWVASRRRKSGNPVNSRPCGACWPLVKSCAYVVFRNKKGEWETLRGDF